VIPLFEASLARLQHNKRYQLAALAAVILLATFLRFFKLGEWSFWGDEYITVRNAVDLFGGGVTRFTPSLVATHVTFSLAGVSEWTARLAAALAGIISVPVLYALLKRQFDAHLALIASLLLAVSPWHLYWSQNARFYTILLLFYTLAIFFFYWALEEDRPLYMLLSLLFFGLAAFERLIAAFFLPTALIYLFMIWIGWFPAPRGLRWRNLAIYLLPGGVFVLLVMAVTPTFNTPQNIVTDFGFVNNNPIWILSGTAFYLGVPLLIMAFTGAVALLWRRDRFGLLLTLGFMVPLVSIVAISLVTYSANRYIFPALTSVIILAAMAIYDLWRQTRGPGKLMAAGVLLIMLLMPMADNMLYFFYQNGNRDNWKAAVEFVATNMEPGDQVAAVDRHLLEYYLQDRAIDMHFLEQAGLGLVTQNQASTWFLLDLTAPDKTPRTTLWVQKNALFIEQFDVVVSARRFPMQIYKYTNGAQYAVLNQEPD
jgi:mannosyltransferase